MYIGTSFCNISKSFLKFQNSNNYQPTFPSKMEKLILGTLSYVQMNFTKSFSTKISGVIHTGRPRSQEGGVN